MRKFTLPFAGIVALLAVIDVIVLLLIRSSTTSALEQSSQADVQAAVAATVSAGDAAAVILTWKWNRPLADDEFFDLRVWHDGDPANGITWTKDASFNLRDWILYQKPGAFHWTVGVVQKAADGSGTEITDLAPEQTFSMSAIDIRLMDVPDGFTSTYYARLPFTQPTVITFGSDGALYALSVEGQVARLTDTDGDQFAETSETIYADADNKLDHAVGMTFGSDNVIYISDGGRISTLTASASGGALDTVMPVVTGLPSQWHTYHSNNGIAFGPDGKLYISVGSTTDHGPLQAQWSLSH